jgi:hypothetical protein
MALYTELPIYRVSYELLKEVNLRIKTFPRDFKFTLGAQLRNECIDLILNIYRANTSYEKVPHIKQILERIQVIKLILRLCRDMNFISTKVFSGISELIHSLSKQTNGWKQKFSLEG